MKKYTGDSAIQFPKKSILRPMIFRETMRKREYRVHLSKFYKVRRKCEWEIEPPPRSKRKAAYQGSSLSLSA